MKKQFIKFLAISFILLCACEDNAETFSIHTETQNSFLNDAYTNYLVYANGEEDISKPMPIELSLENINVGTEILTYEGETLIDSFSYEEPESSYSIYNLKIGTKYKTKYVYQNQEIKTVEYKIDDAAPRNLYIDGVTNCRDIGGWKIDKRHRVKQGLIYRTAKFNEDESTDALISSQGVETLKNKLGIKTEIDLRKTSDNENGGITSSPLGEGVTYVSYPMVSSGNVLTLNKARLKGIFDYFGDEKNYPIVFHCSIGTDRTGLIAFLINGLLGVSEDDLYKDYLFSNFGLIYGVRTPNTLKDYIETIDLSSGTNLSEKIYNYLISNNVSPIALDNLKKLMIEKN